MFTEKFDKYACDGDEITCHKAGFKIVARIQHDEDIGPPWEDHDGHGPVSEWRRKDSKRPGERILCEDRGSCRFYDWEEAMKIARRDGWGFMPYKLVIEPDDLGKQPSGGRATAGPFTAYDPDNFIKAVSDVYRQHRETMTPGQYAEAAVKRDFEALRAWCNNDWCYCGVVLSVYRNNVEVSEHAASLWGIEMNYPDSDNSYLTEVANELLDEAIETAEKDVQMMVIALSVPETVE